MIEKVKSFIKKRLNISLGIENIRDHFFVDNFDKNSIIVDLGASRGGFSKLVSERCLYYRIILIEPNPYLIQDLRLTFVNKKNIEIYNACIGFKSQDSVRFYLGNNPDASSLYKSFSELYGLRKNQSEVNVRMITLDDIFSLFNLKKIDLLKIDIEGEEWNLFENFSKENFTKINQISVEFHDFLDPPLRKRTEKCIKKLRDLGYSFIHQGSGYMYGTPYMNCLFYNRKQLKWTNVLRWAKVKKSIDQKRFFVFVFVKKLYLKINRGF